MSHKLVPLGKEMVDFYAKGHENPYKPVCELCNREEDVTPCSHFDHCERPAVIWIYSRDCFVTAFCQTCYALWSR